jgi:hypothetical protein
MLVNGKIRLVVVIEGTPVGARIVPHKTNDSKLVLKSPHPEGGAALAALCGVQSGEVIQGSSYFIVEVDKAAFLEGLSKGAAAILAEAKPTEPKAEEPAADGKCLECGSVDGTHWAFCPVGKLN